MKLEVGMYVRTETGHIDKIIKIDNKSLNGRTIQVKKGELDYCMGYEVFTDLFGPSHYTKASFNIIDLIEEGDYVNGYYVEDVFETYIYVATGTNYFQSPTIYEQEIKSIVTKEQFQNVSYVVK